MTMRVAVGSVLLAIIATGCCDDADVAGVPGEDPIEAHWAALRAALDYDAYREDPVVDFPDAGIGLFRVPDPLPHLAALVAAAELEHVDLVLPTVPHPSKASVYWMEWFDRQGDDIVYMTGNRTYSAFKPKGEQPLRIAVWYRLSAEPKVQALIEELESLPLD